MVRGQRIGYTPGESFCFVRNVFNGVDVEANALNTTFLCSFASHLHENRLDVFAADSEQTWLFGSLISYILGLRNNNSTPRTHARRIRRSDIDGAQFDELQQHASNIINRSHIFEGTKGTSNRGEANCDLGIERRKSGFEVREPAFEPLFAAGINAAPIIDTATSICTQYSLTATNEASSYPWNASSADVNHTTSNQLYAYYATQPNIYQSGMEI
jgi:hypothetical protein